MKVFLNFLSLFFLDFDQYLVKANVLALIPTRNRRNELISNASLKQLLPMPS